ncbi:MAG: winged helix-turn-helix transcriptional regulator [Candidatus Lokiarchaeota archaeon]|nr:winged helix-turn-helix transcriptional regulator [Candidatus Lokiarchaeota archaeon]
MSMEKRREPRGNKEKEKLQDSSFRRLDFRPLQEAVEVEEKALKKEEIVEELSEIEKDILKIAEEILKLKRYDSEFEIESENQIQKYPIIEKLYAKCIAKLSYRKGYSKEEIFLSIRGLEEKNWIVTNERRTKLEILTNEKLVSILEFIKDNPGIHARDEKIETGLEITRTPFLKHVMTLERFDLIRSKKIGKTLHYFLSEVPEDYDKFKVIFLNPLIPKLLEEIFKDEEITVTKMGENLDIYSGTILYHIKKLKDLNLLKSAKNKSGNKIFLVNFELLKKYNSFFDEPDFTLLLSGLEI